MNLGDEGAQPGSEQHGIDSAESVRRRATDVGRNQPVTL